MKKALHIGMSCCPDFHGQGLKQAFEVNGWEYHEIPTQSNDLNERIKRFAADYRPNLCWIQIQSTGISKEAVEALKAVNCYIIQWSGDIRVKLPDFYFHYAQWGIDLSTFSNMQDVNIMGNCGYESSFLQIGYSPEIYNTTGEVNNLADIVFFGNSFNHFPLSGLRREMVKELKRVYGDRFKAFGSGQVDGNFMGNQPGEAAVYRGAKIGINLSHFDCDRYTSDRLFRMLGCGVCVLSKWYPQIEEDFIHGEHLLVWKDFDELKQQINVILADPTVGKRIGLAGHKLAMDKFKFSDMGLEIINLYNKYSS